MTRLAFLYGIFVNPGTAAGLVRDGGRVLGVARLRGYRVAENGPMTLHTAGQDDYCYGLLWELTPNAERYLDRIEGYPAWYSKAALRPCKTGELPVPDDAEVFAYRMRGNPGTLLAHNNLDRATRVPEILGMPTRCQYHLTRTPDTGDGKPRRRQRPTPPTGKADKERTLYFAYGSNLSVDQMMRRCPSAEVREALNISGWRLGFKRFANIEEHEGSVINGALYALTDQDLAALDRYEALYERLWLDVADVGRVVTYQIPEHRVMSQPEVSYVRVIAAGLKDWGHENESLLSAVLGTGVPRVIANQMMVPASARLIHRREARRDRRRVLVKGGVIRKKKRTRGRAANGVRHHHPLYTPPSHPPLLEYKEMPGVDWLSKAKAEAEREAWARDKGLMRTPSGGYTIAPGGVDEEELW